MKDDKKHLFDDPKNIKRLLNIFYLCCALLVILDFVIHRHTMHKWDSLWAFYPIYGFVGCVVLVVVAKWMRTFLMRPEDYYDKYSTANDNSDTINKNALTNNDLHKKGAHHVDY